MGTSARLQIKHDRSNTKSNLFIPLLDQHCRTVHLQLLQQRGALECNCCFRRHHTPFDITLQLPNLARALEVKRGYE